MSRRGKNHRNAQAKIDRAREYGSNEAIELLKGSSFAKFDETVDICFNLGVNPRHADQMVRGAVVFPFGLGKAVKVVVFAKGDKATEAKDAGADFVGDMDLVTKIKDEGWLDFDKAIATPDMMGLVGRIGKILGPRGLMPNPKVGTVTFDVTKAVNEMKAGRVEFRVDRAGVLHAPIGKKSFTVEALAGNLNALVETIMKLKPATAKGTYMKQAVLSSTMGPGIRLDVAGLQAELKN
ncbi:MAG: 50S ribosomal protein L1 [Myxococcales bacterium]|nr:50S ribosomal protein L1 [Myxococcales bacterium]